MSEKLEKIAPRNWLWTVVVFLWLLNLCFICYYFDILRLPEGITDWKKSNADGFLVFVSILAILGFIWAVRARIDAEKAFRQSEITYEAVTGAFNFDDIYDVDKLPEIYNSIAEPEVTVVLILNFPMLGVFTKGVSPKLIESVRQYFILLSSKINLLRSKSSANNWPKKFKLFIACYSQEYTNSFSSKLPDQSYKGLIDYFYNEVNLLYNEVKDPTKFDRYYFDADIGIRTALALHPKGAEKDSQGIVCLVSDFDKNDPDEFKTACFRTKHISFIEALQKLFDSFKPNIPSVDSVAIPKKISFTR